MTKNRSVALSVVAALALWAGLGCKQAAGPTHFGEPFTDVPRVTPGQLLMEPATFHRRPVRVVGTVERQCPATGCWFFLRDEEGQSIRVELGDYLSKLPRHVGHTAEVEGEWIPQGDGHRFIGTRVSFTRKPAS